MMVTKAYLTPVFALGGHGKGLSAARVFLVALAGLATIGGLSGCSTGSRPTNAAGAAWMHEQEPYIEARGAPPMACHAGPLPPPELAPGKQVNARDLGGNHLLISPGDRLRIALTGDPGLVSGTYVVAADGTISLAGAVPIMLQGLEEPAAAQAILASLQAARVARAEPAFIDVRLIESGGVSVNVSGAVFYPGVVRAGDRPAEGRVGQKEGLTYGDDNPGRTVSSALRAAGGVRPDADIADVYLERQGRWARLDFRALMAGLAGEDMVLQAGDRIYVASTGCFDAQLVRPSAITQPGIRVFMSNLTRPAASNASSAIGQETTSLPYGTRFLQGLVAMNCVGGSAINSRRSAVLISRNPMNGRSIVIQRAIERLVRDADRDAHNPYLMPGDALACYDSALSNFQDVVSLVGSAAGMATTAVVVNQAVK